LPPPLALEELPLSMASALAAHGFSTPTVVQSRCWPICLSGRDMLCIAPTGSGKTLGYALPLLDLARRWATPTPATLALFLLPTRELARQVTGVMEQLLGSSPWTVHAVYGGVDRKQQRQQLKQCAPPTVLVATPGRLLDLAGGISNDGVVAETLVGGADGGTGHNGAPMTTCVSLGLVRYLAIDEADKLLSLGLGEQVSQIAALTHAERQTVLFSATFTADVAPLAATLQNSPLLLRLSAKETAVAALGWVRGEVGMEGVDAMSLVDESVAGDDADGSGGVDEEVESSASLEVPRSVSQEVYLCAEHKKPRRLLRLLEGLLGGKKEGMMGAERRVLIFANKVKTALFVVSLLHRYGMQAEALSSRLTQLQREAVLDRFKSGSLPVLVATDVAARGLHIESLRYVVNWDFGTNLRQYVHRVGRTGRQGAEGRAFSFFSRNLKPLAPAVVRMLRAHKQPVDRYLFELAEEAKGALKAGGSKAATTGGTDSAAADESVADFTVEQGVVDADVDAQTDADVDADVDADESDEEGGFRSTQRWLASRLISPITGQVPCFTASRHQSQLRKTKGAKKRKRDNL